MSKLLDKEKLESYLQDYNRQQAADHFGVHIATVKRAIKRFGIKYKKKSGGHPKYRGNPLDKDLELTDFQNDLMVGSLLGDGFLLDCDIFRIKQKLDRREYVDYLHDQFAPFATDVREEKSRKPTRMPDGTVSHKIEDWKGEYTYSSSFSTRKHRIFKELHQKWYPKGEKIVPKDVHLNETVLTHWYLQDGYHNKNKNYYRFSTQSFSDTEVNKLSEMLNNFLDVNSDVQLHGGGPVIYVTKTNGEEKLQRFFRQNIVFDCFKYKI